MATVYLDSGGASTNSGTSDNNSADLSGSANATVVANATFTDGNVNTGTDQVTVTSHGYSTGTGVELTSSGTLPAGLTLTTLYFLRAVDANTLTFHKSVADAQANTNIVDITAAAGGGTHTINNYTINLGGSPNLSGVKTSRCRVTTTGTSHVITFDGIHGITSGDAVVVRMGTGATVPTGLTNGNTYFANAVSTTTCRLYSTPALAVAGGASDLNVSAAEVRNFELQCLTQSAINLASATNSNRKIFWARAVDDTSDLVIVDVVVTGLGAGSNWAIGGRVSAAGAVDLYNAVRNGDFIVQNTDISANPLNLVYRNPTAWNTSGLTHTGKSGAVRVLTNQGNGDLINLNTSGTGYFRLQNVELQSQGTGGGVIRASGGINAGTFFDCSCTDAGNIGFGLGIGTSLAVRCVATGCDGSGFTGFAHCVDCRASGSSTGSGFSSTGGFMVNCISDSNATDGIGGNSSNVSEFYVNCTVYKNNRHGYNNTTIKQAGNVWLGFVNCIFKDNGDVSTEYNWLLPYVPGLGFYTHDNCVTQVGARGGTNVSGPYSLDATDITTDPLFVDPDAAYATRNLGLQSGSPAKGIPYSFGGLTTSYRDMGAVQRQETGGSSGLQYRANMTGNL